MLGAYALKALPPAVSKVTSHPQALKSLTGNVKWILKFGIKSFKQPRSTKISIATLGYNKPYAFQIVCM